MRGFVRFGVYRPFSGFLGCVFRKWALVAGNGYDRLIKLAI
jgi:hypothetical protein